MTRLVILDCPDCNTTSPEIQAAPSRWDVAADAVLREYAELWRKLSFAECVEEET